MSILGLQPEVPQVPQGPVGQILTHEGYAKIALVDLGREASDALRASWPAARLWVANYYSARNPLRLSSLVILGVVARMFRCATRSSCWCT